VRFQIGDTVKIAKTSMWYGESRVNPKDTEGIITRIDPRLNITYHVEVNWDTGRWSVFREEDLRLVKRSP